MAAEAFETAARLSTAPAPRAERFLASGRMFLTNAQPRRARIALDAASHCVLPDAPARFVIDRLHGMALRALGRVQDALELWVRSADDAAGRPELRDVASAMLADAAFTALTLGDCAGALELGRRGAGTTADDDADRPHGLALANAVVAAASAGRGDERTARTALAMAEALVANAPALSPSTALSQPVAIQALLWLGEHDEAQRQCEVQLASLDASGEHTGVSIRRALLGEAQFRRGDWDAAQENLDAAIAGARDVRQLAGQAVATRIRARLAAARGDAERLATAIPLLAAAREMSHVDDPLLDIVEGHAALAAGHVDDAISRLEAVRDQSADGPGVTEPAILGWWPDLIEAYAMAGRVDTARDAVAHLVDCAGAPAQSGYAAVVERCRGVVADSDFARHFDHALDLHARKPLRFEQARTQLLYGGRLHRARRRVDARRHLAAARTTFESLGAAPWVARADAELRAAGARRRADPSDPDRLSDREWEVARCVSRGLSNREVASELFLSAKTVEFHLTRIYGKLGVRSRTALARRLVDLGEPVRLSQ